MSASVPGAVAQPDPDERLGLRGPRGLILASLMLSTALVALDMTVLSTAVTAVVQDFGGFAQFPWLFSGFMLAQAVTVPVFAKVSDLVGRKPVMLTGIAIFVVASIACGLAWSMPSLIVARTVQGLGAGAVSPIAMTIVGDLYSVEERAKIQGYLASVWGMSAIVGPTLGGLFVDVLNWRWIFFINIPIGIAASLMLITHFHEKIDRRRHKIDVAGAVLLTVGASLLVFGLLQGGVAWAWGSRQSFVVLGSAVVLLAAFVGVERRAAEPILPLGLLRRRVVVGAAAASLLVGVVMIGLTSYVPMYAQNVFGTSALVAGFALATMSVGWPISAALAGRIYLRIGFRSTAFIGTGLLALGTIALTTVNPDTGVLWLAFGCLIVGFGLGLIASPTLVAAQSSVDWTTRGVVTGTTVFARSIGSALGIAMFGAIANHAVASRVGAGTIDLERLPVDVLHPAVHAVFLGTVVCAAVMALAVWVLPRHQKLVPGQSKQVPAQSEPAPVQSEPVLSGVEHPPSENGRGPVAAEQPVASNDGG